MQVHLSIHLSCSQIFTNSYYVPDTASALGDLTLEVENKIHQQIISLYGKCSVISKLIGKEKKSAELSAARKKNNRLEL